MRLRESCSVQTALAVSSMSANRNGELINPEHVRSTRDFACLQAQWDDAASMVEGDGRSNWLIDLRCARVPLCAIAVAAIGAADPRSLARAYPVQSCAAQMPLAPQSRARVP